MNQENLECYLRKIAGYDMHHKGEGIDPYSAHDGMVALARELLDRFFQETSWREGDR
jgi:hypothetical protein